MEPKIFQKAAVSTVVGVLAPVLLWTSFNLFTREHGGSVAQISSIEVIQGLFQIVIYLWLAIWGAVFFLFSLMLKGYLPTLFLLLVIYGYSHRAHPSVQKPLPFIFIALGLGFAAFYLNPCYWLYGIQAYGGPLAKDATFYLYGSVVSAFIAVGAYNWALKF